MSEPSHTHAHSHPAPGAAHAHGGDLVAANKAYFDENADKFEEMFPEWREMARKPVEAFLAHWPALFDKERTAVMDFACGIGFVSEPLSEHVKSIVGVDISKASVDQYNARAARLGLAPERMKGVSQELKGEPGELDGAKFDVIVVRIDPCHPIHCVIRARLIAHLSAPRRTITSRPSTTSRAR